MLAVRNISKSYKGRTVLSNLSFELKSGDSLVIVGESGSGKSSLLKIIGGLLDSDNGEVIFNGEKIKSPSQVLVPGYPEIQMVDQLYNLPAYERLHEIVANQLLGYEEAYRKERVESLLELAGLNGDADKYTRELSGGQQQKLAIAAALANEPSLLLLDEPFSNLDPFSKYDFLNQLSQEAEALNTSLILVTHDIQEALSFGKQIMVLHGSKIAQEGHPRELYLRPRSKFVAQFLGPLNIWTANAFNRLWPNVSNGHTGWVGVRPESLTVGVEEGIPARVVSSSFFGPYYQILIEVSQTEPLVKVFHSEALPDGLPTKLSLSKSDLIYLSD